MWGKLGLVLMDGAMLSKSSDFLLIIYGSFLLPNCGSGNEGDGDLLQKVLCRHCYVQCP